MFRPYTTIFRSYSIQYTVYSIQKLVLCYANTITLEDGRVRPKHVLIEYKKWMCYIDEQKNKYSVLNECNRMLKYNISCSFVFHLPPYKIFWRFGPRVALVALFTTRVFAIRVDFNHNWIFIIPHISLHGQLILRSVFQTFLALCAWN
jgi:hypothetical protein